MQFMVILPDTADPKMFDAIAQAIHQAGGTVQPEEAAGQPEPGAAGAPPAMAGEAPPGMPPMGPALAAGPGAGMAPGAAMAQKGAFALRPRPTGR